MMRKIAGRSQAEYARLVGVSPRVLIEFERGIGNPTLKTLQKICSDPASATHKRCTNANLGKCLHYEETLRTR